MGLVILIQALFSAALSAIGGAMWSSEAALSALAGGFSVAIPTAVLVALLRVVPRGSFPAVLMVGELLRLVAVAVLLGFAIRALGTPHWGMLLSAFGVCVLIPLLFPLLQRYLSRRREFQQIEEILRRHSRPQEH